MKCFSSDFATLTPTYENLTTANETIINRNGITSLFYPVIGISKDVVVDSTISYNLQAFHAQT